ncbi:MAG TPA: LacI family DNA-binding transcriptional regulator [Longimicrobiales bacterium]
MPNIVDVAREAGVSPMTVSRALNRPGLVSPETRAKVLAAVERLGYVPNAVARSLVQGRTQMVALVLSDIQNPFFTAVSRGVEDVAHQYGYTLIVGNTDEQPEKERRYLDVLSSRRVDGVILSTSGADHIRLLRDRGIPVVLIDREIPGVEADVVVNDVYDGGRQLIAHLVERGYREIAFVGGPAGNSTLEQRLAGCRDAAREAGLSLSVHLGRFDRRSGEEIAASLCEAGALPEAIVAANNLVAVGVLVELRRRGLRVPDDVGLACFGEIELASLIDPFLTVVKEPEYQAGRLAMEMLHDRILGFDGAPRKQVLPVELVARRSTQRPGTGR